MSNDTDLYWIAERRYAGGPWEPMNIRPYATKREAEDEVPLSALIGRETRVVPFTRRRRRRKAK